MREIKFKISIILLLVSVVGIAALVGIAQSENTNNNAANFDDNVNLVRVFRLVNGLNKEADKQETKGFARRAEMLRNYFQKKTGISNEAKLKLNELATTFQKESEKVNAETKEIRKNQKNKPNDEALTSELVKLRESRNKLFDVSRESLKNDVSKDDSEKVLKFLLERILEKMRKNEKSSPKRKLENKVGSDLFQEISYNKPVLESYLESYSWIDYDSENNEVWSVSVTQGTCDNIDIDHDDRDYECSSAYVNAVLSDSEGGITSETLYLSGSNAESYLYANPILTGQHCVDAEHQIEDNAYNTLYAQSSDCMHIALIDKVQYQIPNTSNYTDIEGVLYVLKGTTVEFRSATQSDDGIEGNWSGTSGVTGRGETASATFNNISASVTDYKTVIVSNGSNQKNVNVVVYELNGVLTPDDDFAGRSQDTYGVSEIVNLSFSTNPSITVEQIDGLEWKRTSGSGQVTNDNNTGMGLFTSPDTASSESIKLEVINGASKGQGVSYNKSVVAPSSAVAVQNTSFGNVSHTQGSCSVGFYLTPYLRPTNVSFKEVKFYEDVVLPTVATGYYAGAINSSHPLGPQYDVLSGNITTGNKVDFIDSVITDGIAPCANGEFIWDIPWKYKATSVNSSGYLFYTARHRQFIPSPNVVSIEKAGVGPFPKAVSDPSSY